MELPLAIQLLQVVALLALGMELLQVVVLLALGMEHHQLVPAQPLPSIELPQVVLEPQVQCRSMERHEPLPFPVNPHTVEGVVVEAADKCQGSPVTKFQRLFLSRCRDNNVSRLRDKCPDRIVSRRLDRVVRVFPDRVVRVFPSSFRSSRGGGNRGRCVRWRTHAPTRGAAAPEGGCWGVDCSGACSTTTTTMGDHQTQIVEEADHHTPVAGGGGDLPITRESHEVYYATFVVT